MNWPLLHNMSVRPNTVISYSAEDDGKGASATVFELPLPLLRAKAPGLLSAIDGQRFRGSPAEARTRLRSRVEAHARSLPWPPVVVAVDQAGGNPARCDDLLTIVTALAKTGHKAYVRDKEPNLDGLGARRRVVLRIPPIKEAR